MNSKQYDTLQTNETRYLRKVEGKTHRDRIRNTVIKENVYVPSIRELVQQNQLQQYGHLICNGRQAISNKSLRNKIRGEET